MNVGRTFPEFAKEVVRQAATKKDYLAPLPTLQMLIDAGAVQNINNLDAAIRNTEDRPPVQFSMRIGDTGGFHMRKLFHDQLREFCGIPKPYYDRMRTEEPELLIHNVQTWLNRSAHENPNMVRMIRTLDGHARAFLSDIYRPLDNIDLVIAIKDTLVEVGAVIDSCELTETRLYIKCTSHKITCQPKVGDIIEAGVLIQNSEVGMGRLVVGPFLKRLACSNGMIIDDFAFRRTHIGKRSGRRGGNLAAGDVAVGGGSGQLPEEWLSDETRKADDVAFFGKVRDMVKAYFDPNKLAEISGKLDESTKRTIDANPVSVVKVIKNDYVLTDDEEAKILANLITGADLSQYGLAQAVTALAGDVSDYERSTELERAGGQVIQLADTDWEDLLKESKKLAA